MKYCVLIITGCLLCLLSIAQPGTTVELKKPKKYENRTLISEKSGDTKFGIRKHVFQNMVTHYNYYFNANQHLNNIIAAAKVSHRDDYTKLLSFYNYDLNTTASASAEIDSIIYHVTAGVLLHDLRNDWIDDMYFLLGKAYYYRKNFDSALISFRYINYAWAPKDDGYDIPIGSSESGNNGEFSIATKEKTNVLHKTIIEQPVRNANFLWMARTNVEMSNDGIAAGLLQILQHDPNFPKRLQTQLHESLAYLYYNQNKWDSAAINLDASLNNATNRFERARWEYLIAQMYVRSGNTKAASDYYERAASHTTDPIMEVNAYLSSLTINKDTAGAIIQDKLNSLLQMGKREKYVQYRDVIYYAAAQVEMQLNDTASARKMLKQSIRWNVDNVEQKSLSFLMLADISYNGNKWIEAHRFYDSTGASYIFDSAASIRLNTRQPALDKIAASLANVDKEDSLQQVASLPEAQRTAYLKKALRQMRKAQGLSEDEPNYGGNNLNPSQNLQTQAQLFQNPSSSTDWYFNSTSLKSGGFGEFRQQWGNRPNVDNWRRQDAIAQSNIAAQQQQQVGNDVDAVDDPNSVFANGKTNHTTSADQNNAAANPQSVDDLAAGLPLTPGKMVASNNNKAEGYYKSGLVFQEELTNYPAAIEMYQHMKGLDDSSDYRELSLLNLYYCYSKLKDKYHADSALALLKKDYPKGKSLASLEGNGKKVSEKSNNSPATKAYENIYNLFIEGNFAEAEKQKAAADSLYGNSYWTPQLLYIESIYYISQHNDSTAMKQLLNLETKFTASPLAQKAATMIDVLKRRSEIERYLTNLQVTRNEDTSTSPVINLNPTETASTKPVRQRPDSIVSTPPPVAKNPVVIKTDTSTVKTTAKAFKYNAADPQFVVLLLDKVAPVFASEAKNAFNRYDKQTFYNLPQLNATGVKLDDRYNLVLVGPFTDAIGALDYVDKVRPVTAGKILPWLTPDKFTFLMISQANLDLLNANKDLEGYKAIIQKALPGKF